MRRLRVGSILLLLIAIPSIVHSKAAIESLLNVPPDWVPDTLAEKAEFNELTRRFSVTDVLMISWPGAKLGSESFHDASACLQPLCEDPNEKNGSIPTLDEFDAEVKSAINEILVFSI